MDLSLIIINSDSLRVELLSSNLVILVLSYFKLFIMFNIYLHQNRIFRLNVSREFIIKLQILYGILLFVAVISMYE